MFRQTLRVLAAAAVIRQSPTVVSQRCLKRWVSPTLRELKKRRAMAGPEPLTNRKTFVEWNLNAELYAFGQRLGEPFDQAVLQQAFTHRSYIVQEELRQQQHGIAQPETNLRDNRELQEAGGRLLAEHVGQFVRVHWPRLPEDGVKAVVEHLLSDAVLANVSRHLGTSDLILTAEFPVEESTLAATLRAVVGALEPGRSFAFVRDFVCAQLNQKDINVFWHIERPVELLQELCAARNLGTPEPRLIGEAGSNTLLACYQVGLYDANRQLLASGFGENVDTAIAVAARNALARLFGTDAVRSLNMSLTAEECERTLQADAAQRRREVV